MKTLLALALALLSVTASSFGVTWHVVNVSVTVKQSTESGSLNTLVLTSRSYINFVSVRDSTPKNDLFVGFRENTGEIAVVRKSDETVRYNIISGIGAGGNASNGTGTQRSIAAPATVSSLNTDFSGFVYDTAKRSPTGALKSVSRLAIGGFQTQTIKGTFTTTGKKIEL